MEQDWCQTGDALRDVVDGSVEEDVWGNEFNVFYLSCGHQIDCSRPPAGGLVDADYMF